MVTLPQELTTKPMGQNREPRNINPWVYGNLEQYMTELSFQINRKRMDCLTKYTKLIGNIFTEYFLIRRFIEIKQNFKT